MFEAIIGLSIVGAAVAWAVYGDHEGAITEILVIEVLCPCLPVSGGAVDEQDGGFIFMPGVDELRLFCVERDVYFMEVWQGFEVLLC